MSHLIEKERDRNKSTSWRIGSLIRFKVKNLWKWGSDLISSFCKRVVIPFPNSWFRRNYNWENLNIRAKKKYNLGYETRLHNFHSH